MLNKAIILLVAAVFAAPVLANDFSNLPAKKQTQFGLYFTAKQAHDYINSNTDKSLFVDVRTRAEVNFLGTPSNIDANIPYMELNEWWAWNEKRKTFKMEVNSNFADDIAARLAAKGLGKDDTIVLMCRSGSRSAKAADLLKTLGYTKVYSIVDGYEGDTSKTASTKGQRIVNGWKNSQLPWSYKLDKEKMYNVGG
ncbi:MAG: rhodanese-like domain-containing protein [Gammaproteobacteria bacterium]|nr:rhodanese-like domain-containing protein [Gammaproteobacteria bacterium]MDH5731935.1 rhodanese-like domain-containing protein [Gammaproteobacteria bacterium]